MDDTRILIAVPSMGREDVIQKSIIPEYSKVHPIHVVVFESEVLSYTDCLPNTCTVHGIPDDMLGKQKKLNWIMENLFTEEYDMVIMLDDDIKKFMWMMEKSLRTVTPEDFMNTLVEDMELCNLLEAKVFSLGYSKGPKFMNRFQSLSINTSILGGAMCILDHSVRFDPQIMLAEDVDIAYMEQFRRGIIFKDERIAMDAIIPINAGDGGQTQYRSAERIRQTRQYLRDKYGAWVKVNRAV